MAKKGYIGGGPKGEKGFPDYDAKHARLAISGATRSYHAGNISASEAARIKAAARKKLASFNAHGHHYEGHTRHED